MKRPILYSLLIGGLLVAAGIAANQYTGTLLSNPVQAVDTTGTVNMTTVVRGGITQLSAQANLSSTTVPAVTFNDGRVSSGSITVASTAGLLSNAATNQITLAATATLLASGATNYLTVLSTSSLTSAVITYGLNKIRQGYEWTAVATTTGTAAAITTALNKYYGLTATRSTNVINLTIAGGAAGNGKALSVNTSSITAGGTTFGGGYNSRIATAEVFVNGVKLRQGRQWQADVTSSGTATNLAAIINKVSGVKAVASGSVIYATATVAGVAGNAFTMTSNAPSYVTVANPTFTGGIANATIGINGVTLTQGTNWTAASTSSGTAKAISDAITASSSLSAIIKSTWTAGGVVFTTSTAAGASKNYAMVTNAPSNFTLSGVSMLGGLTPAYSAGGTAITVPAHGMGTGLSVVYSTGTGVNIAPLVPGTVYYTAKLDANTLALATSRANAAAGTYITLLSTTTAGPDNFTLTPQALSGTAYLVWSASNDCSSFSNLVVSSVTFATPYTAAQNNWDFGTVNYKCVRASFTAPTTGGVNLAVTVNGN